MKRISNVNVIPIAVLLLTNRPSLSQVFFRISHLYIKREKFLVTLIRYLVLLEDTQIGVTGLEISAS
jgi:hypothetical protein